MRKLQKSQVYFIGFILIVTVIAVGTLWFYREWRSNQIIFEGNYHGEAPGLYRMNLLFGRPILIASGSIVSPRWSPDGSRIAYVSSGDEAGRAPYHIAVMDSNGKNIQELTEGDVRQYSPAWSPDGEEIAFIFARDYEGGSPLAIFTVHSDGSEQKQLTPYAYFIDLSWSPDGKWIVYSTFNSISVVSTDGADYRQLTDQWTDSFPVWSPDGEYIAFQSTRDDPDEHFDIYVMRADGSELRRLTVDPAHDRKPSWSPDGKQIIFESNRDSDDWIYHIYRMNADGTKQERLVEMESNAPAWRP